METDTSLVYSWLMDQVPFQCFMSVPIGHVLLPTGKFPSLLSVSLREVFHPKPCLSSAHWHPDRSTKVTDESEEHKWKSKGKYSSAHRAWWDTDSIWSFSDSVRLYFNITWIMLLYFICPFFIINTYILLSSLLFWLKTLFNDWCNLS